MNAGLIVPDWKLSGVKAGFSTAEIFKVNESVRDNADMGLNTLTHLDITKSNRAKFAAEIGLDPDSLALVRQVHGTEVIKADYPGILGEADGLITDKPGLSLGILVADCASVLVCDPNNRVIGAFHAGWRGAAGGILIHGIRKMKELGGTDFQVWLSPCIGVNAFEVGEEVAKQFPDEFVHKAGFEKPHVDLKSFLIQQLQDIGVQRDRIFVDSRCTFEESSFFSYRRQSKESGRMMGVIGLV